MRIAGVYASAFLLSLPNILFFLIFKTVVCVQKRETKFFIYVQKRETAMNHTPVYTFGLGYPPMTKTNLFTIQNSKHNEKN